MIRPMLEYADRSSTPWFRRRGVRRAIAALTVILLVAVARYSAPPIWRRATARLLLHRCLDFSAPADHVTFDADPIRAAARISKDSQYWNSLSHESPASAVASWAPPLWVSLIGQVDPTLRTYRLSPPLVFMHERTTADGARRLAILRYAGTANAEAGPATHAFECDLIDPKRGLSPDNISTQTVKLLVMKHPIIRLYAGQHDSTDHSHFAFKYETEDGGGVIDGWLMDGTTVRLQVRDGPEKLE